jgi:hypothetical protein
MPRRQITGFAIAALFSILGGPTARALPAIRADQAPKADANLLRALNQ